MANKVPVLPKPVCTSSATITIECLSQKPLKELIASCETGMNPPSPATGSITIQAIFWGSNPKSDKSILCSGNSRR